MKQYHITTKGEQSGPFPESELRSMLVAGEIAPNDLCWTEGMKEWEPIRKVIEGLSVMPTSPSSDSTTPPIAEASVMFCPKCGEKNPENNFKCSRCGIPIHASPNPHYVVVDGAIGGLIPTKNSSALIGYYLGVFSLIPFLGIPLGIAAVILGFKGLNFAKLNPTAGGTGHSWTAIILGGLSIVGYCLLGVLFIAAQALTN
jgi:hypothetical protein